MHRRQRQGTSHRSVCRRHTSAVLDHGFRSRKSGRQCTVWTEPDQGLILEGHGRWGRYLIYSTFPFSHNAIFLTSPSVPISLPEIELKEESTAINYPGSGPGHADTATGRHIVFLYSQIVRSTVFSSLRFFAPFIPPLPFHAVPTADIHAAGGPSEIQTCQVPIGFPRWHITSCSRGAVVAIRLRFRPVLPLTSHWVRRLTLAANAWSIVSKHDVIHKTGSSQLITTPPAENPTTAADNRLHVQKWKFGEVWICGSWNTWADRQTRSSQYCTPLAM